VRCQRIRESRSEGADRTDSGQTGTEDQYPSGAGGRRQPAPAT
jgi:hypothetical protein